MWQFLWVKFRSNRAHSTLHKKKGRQEFGGLFLCMSRNEDGRVERPAEQLIYQLPQATRAVSKARTRLHAASAPLARR